MGPELGLTQPGMTIVCGDSHTSTHGAFGALAFGIGTSEVEHVLATQTLLQARPKTMLVRFRRRAAVRRDRQGHGARRDRPASASRAASAHAIEYAGPAIEALSMEGRMTICNMSIEAGARAGMVAPDETTFAYLAGRPGAPRGAAFERRSITGARCRAIPTRASTTTVEIDVTTLRPQVTWGTNPGMVVPIDGVVPDPAEYADPAEREAAERALHYMALEPGTPLAEIQVDRVFIGSCTNARIEDLRAAAAVADGRQVASTVRALVVPGSAKVKRQAEAEGLDRVFTSARLRVARGGLLDVPRHEPGHPRRRASAAPRPRTATSKAARAQAGAPIWSAPAMAAAAAVTGRFTDVRELA